MRNMKKRWIPVLILALLIGAFLIYTGNYYRADETARAALVSDAEVAVSETSYGWFFDGPSTDDALIFYPGAKVEAEAYAPFLRLLAQDGLDVCLVRMPFHLAFFGINRADSVMAQHTFRRWYIGGHSLGGAMAASYAASHGNALTGLVLCAAYPTKPLDASLLELTVYGSEDTVLNLKRVADGAAYAPDTALELVLAGGNHAQFGSYGVQSGDGAASISAAEQQRQAAAFILDSIRARSNP